MNDFVSVMTDYIYDERHPTQYDQVILTSLVKWAMGGIFEWNDPVSRKLAELLGEELDKPEADVSIRASFAAALRNRPTESIEKLLERADTTTEYGFRYGINRLFFLVNRQVRGEILENFLRRQFSREDTSHIFVSFNYDLILDYAVQELSAGEWDVSNGYGIPINYYTHSVRSPIKAMSLPNVQASTRFRILKPHGSLNWLAPHEFDNNKNSWVLREDPLIVPLTESQHLRYWGSIETFVHAAFPGGDRPRIHDVMPYIVPPTPTKPIFANIWQQEREAVREANEIYVIGWSIPKTDEDQICLIRQAAGERTKAFDSITVINKAAKPEYFRRVASTFRVGESDLQIFNAGF